MAASASSFRPLWTVILIAGSVRCFQDTAMMRQQHDGVVALKPMPQGVEVMMGVTSAGEFSESELAGVTSAGEASQAAEIKEDHARSELSLMIAGRVPPGGHAILISLQREPQRATRIRESLGPLVIDFLPLPAVDGAKADRKVLDGACGDGFLPNAPEQKWPSDLEKAIAASHLHALQLAAQRSEEWTLILEDDIALLPIPPHEWLAGFDSAWQRLKGRDVAVVRLGWCLGEDHPAVESLGNGFQLVHNTHFAGRDPEGACTSGYIVNKKYIPDMIQAFASCRAPVDVFYAQIFSQPPFNDKVWSITHEKSNELFKGWAGLMSQHGLLAQRDSASHKAHSGAD